jgi:hypothetical protein
MKKKTSTKKPAAKSAKKTTRKKTATKKPAPKKSARKKPAAMKSAPIVAGGGRSTLTFLTESLPAFRVGRLRKTRIQAVGGTQPYSFGLSPGSSLPPGFALSYTGILVGKPTHSGDTTIFVKVTDFIGAHLTQAFDLEVVDA